MIAEQLRRSILQAAVQGKLTQQLPNDGDANDLVKVIQEEKARLIREGKIKKQQLLLEITEDEIPFNIPENWSWIRLGDVISVSSGNGLTQNDMDKQGVYPVYGGNGISGNHNEWFVPKDTLVIGRVGFYCGCVHKTISNCWVTDNALIVDMKVGLFTLDFLKLVLTYLDLKSTSVATAQPVISGMRIYPTIIPLPPLAEQSRIIERIEEFLPEIDKLKIDESKLDVLQRDFPKKMKDSILQYAVEGKLTEQLPSDGDARDLLKKIQEEKARLIKEGKISKEKTLPEITDSEIPFDIPENWCWVRLGNVILQNIGGGTPSKSNTAYWSGGIAWASVKDLNCKFLSSTKDYISEAGLNNSSTNLIPKGNLIVCTRMGLGKIVYNTIDVAINQDLRALLFSEKMSKWYIYYFYLTLNMAGKGATVKGISVEELSKALLPLPPFAEQCRIVQRLEQLLPEIDKLKAMNHI
jgi:type I restriction enzyme, S subunit